MIYIRFNSFDVSSIILNNLLPATMVPYLPGGIYGILIDSYTNDVKRTGKELDHQIENTYPKAWKQNESH